MKEIVLIEAPTNLGLKEPAPGIEPGVKFFPAALEKQKFSVLAGIKEKLAVIPPAYSMQLDIESKIRNADAIADYSQKLAETVKQVIEKNKMPLVIGGDCSMMIGNTLALKQKGDYGLFHLDGHTDYMWPEFSQTGGAAGMGLALVAGVGHEKLTNISGLRPYIKEENIYCVGNREYDDEYVALSVNSGMRYIDLAGIRSEGIKNIVNDFLKMIHDKKLDGFWIHFDVDALNDEIMPCVDSRTEDGLWYNELKEMLKPLIQSPQLTGMEITILDPTLDRDEKYIPQFTKEILEVLHSAK
ncbi:arginase family protein [Terrimonas pollutisoli]|uniref:arginase family protein n=1 Tax=Terrimonas pollutisoli TaxID=3034147 RepID=UPI0023EBEE30|nr:arginase family protein [Terrimonas sp. H1YJ31]